MSKVKFLSIAALTLLVTNLALAGFILLRKPPHPDRGRPRKIIIEKLHLDEAQVKEYDKLIDWHRTAITKVDSSMLSLKNQLYQTIIHNSGTVTDSLMQELNKAHAQIETIHFRHFKDIKNLCKADQQDEFEQLVAEIASLFAPPPMKEPAK